MPQKANAAFQLHLQKATPAITIDGVLAERATDFLLVYTDNYLPLLNVCNRALVLPFIINF